MELQIIKKFELVSAFEVMEYFENPIMEINKMIEYSNSILLTTNLLILPVPDPKDWWYYGLEHGQHISFYTYKTLKYIASKMKINLYSDYKNLHLFTKNNIKNSYFNLLLKLKRFGLFYYVKKRMNSLTISDMYYVASKININKDRNS